MFQFSLHRRCVARCSQVVAGAGAEGKVEISDLVEQIVVRSFLQVMTE
jgi:hypothetical protein